MRNLKRLKLTELNDEKLKKAEMQQLKGGNVWDPCPCAGMYQAGMYNRVYHVGYDGGGSKFPNHTPGERLTHGACDILY